MRNNSISLKILFHCIIITLLICSGAANSSADWSVETAVDIGQRNAELDWSIAGTIDGTDPNIISELTWRNLEINEVGFRLKIRKKEELYLRGYISGGAIDEGKNQDSDYAYDNRQGEFSRTNNQANDGSVLDLGAGIGVPLSFTFNESHRLQVIPLIGLSYHEQNLTMRNGVQTVSDNTLAAVVDGCCPPAVGTVLSDLNSTYDTEWATVWLGLDMVWQWGSHTKITANTELHFVDYSATADWNLRDEFEHPISFGQWANGTGFVVTLGVERKITRQLVAGMALDYQRWETDTGLSQFYLDPTHPSFTPGDQSIINSQFNGANLSSSMIRFQLAYEFASF